jgi:hypothetical protein
MCTSKQPWLGQELHSFLDNCDVSDDGLYKCIAQHKGRHRAGFIAGCLASRTVVVNLLDDMESLYEFRWQ